MKYAETRIVFSEVPNEISLAITISNCKWGCRNCHSSYLLKDEGNELTPEKFEKMLTKMDGITCVCLMGGDRKENITLVNSLFTIAKTQGLKTCWYIGSAVFPYGLNLHNVDFIKLGQYNENLGPLTSKTTNQKFLKLDWVNDTLNVKDMTYLFWK